MAPPLHLLAAGFRGKMRRLYSNKIRALVFLLCGLCLPLRANPLDPDCQLTLALVTQHDASPYRAYPVDVAVAVDPAGRFVVSARKDTESRAIVNGLSTDAPVSVTSVIENQHRPIDVDSELRERGVISNPITAVAVSPPDAAGMRRIAIADDEGYVDVHDAATGRHLYSLPRHSHAVSTLLFSPGGGGLATTAYNHAELFTASTGSPLRGLQASPGSAPSHSGRISVAGFFPTGQLPGLVTGSQDGTARLWDFSNLAFQTGYTSTTPRTLRLHDASVTALSFAPRSPLFALGDAAGRMSLWNPRGQYQTSLTGPASPVTGLNFSLDGTRLLGVHENGSGSVWNPVNGTQPVVIPAEAYGSMTSGHLIREGRYALTSHEDGKIRIWEVAPPEGGRRHAVLRYEYAGHEGGVSSVIMLPDSRFLSTGVDGTVRSGQIPRIPLTTP